MRAPRCPYCGLEEWGHLCVGAGPSEIERRVVRAALVEAQARAVEGRGKRGAVAKKEVVGKRGRPRVEGVVSAAAERQRRRRERLRREIKVAGD